MKLLKVLSGLCIIIITLVGCNDNSNTHKELWPLKIGNQWIYKTMESDNLSEFEYDTLTVTKDTIINQKKWFMVEHTKWSSISWILRYENDDLIILGDENDEVVFMKYPDGLNNNTYLTIGGDSVKVIENVTVNIDNRKYNCFHYQGIREKSNESNELDESDEFDYKFNPADGLYCVPGIGVVKYVGFGIYALEKYSLKE